MSVLILDSDHKVIIFFGEEKEDEIWYLCVLPCGLHMLPGNGVRLFGGENIKT